MIPEFSENQSSKKAVKKSNVRGTYITHLVIALNQSDNNEK